MLMKWTASVITFKPSARKWGGNKERNYKNKSDPRRECVCVHVSVCTHTHTCEYPIVRNVCFQPIHLC